MLPGRRFTDTRVDLMIAMVRRIRPDRRTDKIIEAPEFGSINAAHVPMMQALALIDWYEADADNDRVKGYAVPVEGIIHPSWRSCCSGPAADAATW